MYSHPSFLLANIDVTLNKNIDIHLIIQYCQPLFTVGDILQNFVILISNTICRHLSAKMINIVDLFFLAFFELLKLLKLLCAKNAEY